MFVLASEVVPDALTVDFRLGAARRGARRLGRVASSSTPIFRTNDDDDVHAAGDPADRAPLGRRRSTPTCPGSSSSRSTGSRCRCCGARCATATRRRWRAGSPTDGYELTEWETDLSSQTGASQAGHPARLERGHPRLPLGREGERDDDDVLEAGRLRGDRAAPLDRRRPAARRRREPRQPALGRGRPRDPDREPDRRGEAREPRLPRVLRERLQRHARARAVLLGGRSSSGRRRSAQRAARRPAARPSRRHLPVHARGDVRVRPRPDRLRRDLGHDERPARGLRDVLELRRGRAPLRARARGHARGAAQARPAVRPDRARSPRTRRGRTRSSSSPTTARRRARRSSSGTATASTTSSSRSLASGTAAARRTAATRTTRWSGTRSTRRRARPGADGERGRRRRARTWSCSARATSASSTSWRSRAG